MPSPTRRLDGRLGGRRPGRDHRSAGSGSRGGSGWSSSVSTRRCRPAPGGAAASRRRLRRAVEHRRGARREAVFAVNAGQFTCGPWGWLVQGGAAAAARRGGAARARRRRAGRGAPWRSSAGQPGRRRRVRRASSPIRRCSSTTVRSRRAPRRPGRAWTWTTGTGGSRWASSATAGSSLALTRVEGLGGLLEVAPFGRTTPEMAALMGALGCRRAVLLDGGLSGQMMVVDDGRRVAWKGLRQVAAGLVGLPRAGLGRADDGGPLRDGAGNVSSSAMDEEPPRDDEVSALEHHVHRFADLLRYARRRHGLDPRGSGRARAGGAPAALARPGNR